MDHFLEKNNIRYKKIEYEYEIYCFDIFNKIIGIDINDDKTYFNEDELFDYLVKEETNEIIDNFINEYLRNVIDKSFYEIIKDIPDYEGYYQVSTNGYIISLKTNKILQPTIQDGYSRICIGIKSKNWKLMSLHSLIAKTFLKMPQDGKKYIINHDNGIRHDNRLENLKYRTESEKAKNAYKIGNAKPTGCKIVCKLDSDGKVIDRYSSIRKAARENNIKSVSNISACINNPTYTAGGYHWRFSSKNKEYKPKLQNDEIFKKIGIYKNFDLSNYAVSNYGNIKNITTNKLLKSSKNKAGYLRISLAHSLNKEVNTCIHQLVAFKFAPIPKNIDYKIAVVNHIDEIKDNNFYKNLEWLATSKENVTYSTGKKVKQIDKNTGKLIKIHNSVRQAATTLNKKFGATDIRRVCLGKYPSAYGYIWEFV